LLDSRTLKDKLFLEKRLFCTAKVLLTLLPKTFVDALVTVLEGVCWLRLVRGFNFINSS